MRRLLLNGICLGLLTCIAPVLPSRALAQDSSVATPDRDAIRQVVRQQLDAFRRDDGAAAFGFASPGIQAQFGHDPDTFMSMVKQAYQPVYRPRSAVLGATSTVDGQVVQKVELVGPDGGSRQALYFMEHEPDGSWRISGCALTESADVGA